MSVKDFLLDAVEDLVTLEVATLTNKEDKPLNLDKNIPKDKTSEEYKTYYDSQEKVKTKRTELLKVIENKTNPVTDKKELRKKIREAKKTLKEAEKQFEEVNKALGIYDPKDIFSQIRSNLNKADLVAYSRFELEGDSVNFINSKENVKDLIPEHKSMVAASQEARKALFDTALNAIEKVIPG